MELADSLDNHFPWHLDSSGVFNAVDGKFVICTEVAGARSSEFAALLLISRLLKQGQHVKVVALNHTRRYFEITLRKLVIYAKTLCES
jgi:hypothetical protein